MRVKVDEAGHDVEPRRVDNAGGLVRRQILGHARDLALGDGHIERRVDLVLRIDHPPAFDEKIPLRGLCAEDARSQHDKSRQSVP